MTIVLCVKPTKKFYITNEIQDNELCISPYDLYSLKCALSLKDKFGAKIICVCMGSSEVEPLLRKCLAYGVDEAILLNDHCFAGADTFATTYVITKAIEKIEDYSLILCGKKTVDGETGQVPFGIAYRLNIPCISNCNQLLSINKDNGSITLIMENSCSEDTLEVQLPLVVSFSNFSTEEPKINLKMIKRAKNQNVLVWNSKQIEADTSLCGSQGSKTKVIDLKSALPKRTAVSLVGEHKDVAKMIYKIINEKCYFEG